eukprot:Gb_37437 [translate_table: standard]
MAGQSVDSDDIQSENPSLHEGNQAENGQTISDKVLEDEDPDTLDDLEEEDKTDLETQAEGHRKQVQKLIKRLSSEQVQIRVHDIKIKGNTKTKDSVIEAELDEVKNVKTMQELVQAATKANARLQSLGIFDSAAITLDAGPPELPDTANVIVEVEEAKKPISGNIGIFSKPEVFSVLIYLQESSFPF